MTPPTPYDLCAVCRMLVQSCASQLSRSSLKWFAGVRVVEGGVVVEDAANTEGAAEETSAGDGESLAGEDGRGKDGERTTGGEREA